MVDLNPINFGKKGTIDLGNMEKVGKSITDNTSSKKMASLFTAFFEKYDLSYKGEKGVLEAEELKIAGYVLQQYAKSGGSIKSLGENEARKFIENELGLDPKKYTRDDLLTMLKFVKSNGGKGIEVPTEEPITPPSSTVENQEPTSVPSDKPEIEKEELKQEEPKPQTTPEPEKDLPTFKVPEGWGMKRIAKAHGITVEELLKANVDQNGKPTYRTKNGVNYFLINQEIKLPEGAKFDESMAVSPTNTRKTAAAATSAKSAKTSKKTKSTPTTKSSKTAKSSGRSKSSSAAKSGAPSSTTPAPTPAAAKSASQIKQKGMAFSRDHGNRWNLVYTTYAIPQSRTQIPGVQLKRGSAPGQYTQEYNGRTYYYRYDSKGYCSLTDVYEKGHQILCFDSPEINAHSYEDKYDAAGHKTSRIERDSNGNLINYFTYQYDASGKKIGQLRHDANGNVIGK